MLISAPTLNQPSEAQLGSTPGAKAAYDRLPRRQRDAALGQVRSRLGPPQQYVRRTLAPQTPVFPGVMRRVAADLWPASTMSVIADAVSPLAADPSDADRDRLPDKFERRLANAFTPFYHVSRGERDVFATFQDQPTLAIATLGPATPPISHYRVTPIGVTQGYGYLQLDYLTVWNHDSGLEISTLCGVLTAGLGLNLEGVAPHAFDEERSAVLVGAPAAGNTYAPDVAAYKAYDFYVAAHEGVVPFDHSAYLTPSQPVDAGFHLELALSRAKHGTYPFNPHRFPIVREEIINATFATISSLHAAGAIDDDTYLALLYAATTAFFECIVERFEDQGVASPTSRTNVGELTQPLNSCAWINDPRIRGKLDPLLWGIS